MWGLKMKKRKGLKITGTLKKHRRGYGFVIPEEHELTGGKDIYIPRDEMKSAMNNDIVTVYVDPIKAVNKNMEGQVERVLKRATTEIVGTFNHSRGYGYVSPENSTVNEELYIQKKDFNGAKDGDKVVAQITKWPNKDHFAQGKITEIISRKGEAGGDIKALIRSFNIIENFPHKVLREAQSIPQTVSDSDIINRRDLREKTIVTIDGEDAKDLDDAISLEKLDNGNYLLGVHIADVSHYVKEKGYIDKEALKRGTSIYLIDIVVPMLPQSLSNGICSLNPGLDRLTLSIDMEIDSQGRVISHDIYESVIRSKERLVYKDVSDLLENKDNELKERFKDIYPNLLMMQELASILKNKRKDRGSLDFDFDEAYITLDEEGIPVSVNIAERRVANRMIEEFMLVANETIAEHFYHMDLPFVFRIHEKPSFEKIEELKLFLSSLGLTLKGNSESIHPKALNDILTRVEDTNSEHVVNTVVLRSMRKAFYGTQCLGHFGLGVDYYCHFTAPIRRYPDLIIHRIIKETLKGKLHGNRIKSLDKLTEEASDIASKTERIAEELEREVEKLKKAEYISYHIGEEFDGIISGVQNFGFFVVIENTIEGLVRVDSLHDDYYIYEEAKYRLIGEMTHKTYRIGDSVRIRVQSVDIQCREIEFVMA